MNITNRVKKNIALGEKTLADYIYEMNLLSSYQNMVMIYYYYASKWA